MIDILEKNENEIKQENLLDTLLKKSNSKTNYEDFSVLILNNENEQNFSEKEMFGVTGLNYIKNAVNVCDYKVVNFNNEDVIKVIKTNMGNKKFVAVVFSDTPLLTKQTFLEILDYFIYKDLCALKFNRGYVFECEYLRSVEKVYNPQVQNFNEEDFLKVNSSESFSKALNVLKNRILNYHFSNNVIIKSPETTFIDAEVNIEKNVIIEPFTVIKGKSIIKSKTVIENSTVFNAIIHENCKITNSNLNTCVIKPNCVIEDYSVIKNTTIEENSIISNKEIRG